MGTRIQHAECVSWDLRLNSRCETTPQSAWEETGLERRNSPFAPLLHRPRRSVLVDPKDPDSVELRQFGDQDAHEGDGVDDEVYPVVLGIKAG